MSKSFGGTRFLGREIDDARCLMSTMNEKGFVKKDI